MQIPMQISGLMVDPVTNMPIVILKDAEEQHVLPIWVGAFEANAIAMRLEEITPPRPMTHDLLHDVLAAVDAGVQRIVVSDLRDNTYYAVVHIELAGKDYAIDARPSDAIALALRAEAPLFVEQAVLDVAESGLDQAAEADRLRRWFESLNPQDFSKYQM